MGRSCEQTRRSCWRPSAMIGARCSSLGAILARTARCLAEKTPLAAQRQVRSYLVVCAFSNDFLTPHSVDCGSYILGASERFSLACRCMTYELKEAMFVVYSV